MNRELFTPNRLFCPGPTPSPWNIKSAALESNIYHRSKEFEAIVLDCAHLLKPFFGTKTQPIILTSSGTGAMESAVVNLTEPGDQVIVVVGGKFGERWQKINQAYANHVTIVSVEPGKGPTAEQISAALKSCPNAKAFFFQAHETSTGAKFDVKSISQQVKGANPETLIVVDAISSLGSHHLQMDEWQIDCVVGGSQKGFGIGPGLSFVALSDRAWDRLSSRPKFYFDLAKEKKGQATGRTSWTPAIGLIQNLHTSVKEINAIGVDTFLHHHERMAKACRAAMTALNLEIFVEESCFSNTLTAINIPAGIDGSKVLAIAKEKYGAIISGGQDELKGKIIRFSHLGFSGPFMLLEGIAALEFSFQKAGFPLKLGTGVSAAMTSLAQSQN